MDSLMYFDSGSRGDDRRQSDDEILNNLVHVPVGHHYLVLYSDMQVLRKIYSTYVKAQMEANPNSVIVLLPYYDTTDTARQILESRGLNVRENETQGSFVIVDIESVITNPYFKGPDTEKLRAFTKEIESKSEGKTIFVIADMSVFHHTKLASELLEYERALHKDLKVEKWKELCFYNERDFDIMFTKAETEELLVYHKDRVIKVS